MTGAVAVACAVLGLVVGSFLNVVIYRVPRGESVVRPRSRCPGCESPIAPRDNVPVLSWLILRGRCRHCGERIGIRYPAVEGLTALLFAAVGARFGLSWALPAYLYLAAAGVALAAIDLDTLRLPDAITKPSYVVVGLLLLLPAVLDPAWHAYLRAWIAAGALWAFYAALSFLYPGGMGWGDVKISGVLGLALGWLGWGAVLVGSFAAFLLGGVVGVALLVGARAGRKHKMPFGPYMVAGAFLGIFVGAPLAHAYTGLFS